MASAELPSGADAGLLHIEVVVSPAAGVVERQALQLPGGATAQDALIAAAVFERHPQAAQWTLGVWGRACPGSTPLRDRDRVELYRPLQVDPKEARRLRYKGQRRSARGPKA